MANDEIPTFNLKAVVLETGLKPDTLRAWERRYGMPDPDRSGGGHRLYSQNDINTLKWLLARQDEGLSISRAVSLWRSLKAEGRDPLQVYPLSQPQETESAYSAIELGDTVIELRQAWIEACLAFDERKAEVILNQAFSYYSPEVVCFELLQKALLEIGNGWYAGNVSVQQEHFASALAMRRLDALLAATPAPTRPGRIIVGCPPGDNHTFSPLLVTFLLRRRGWDVVYLGGDVPTNRLHNTVAQTRPELVVFSAQLLDTAASLLDVANYLKAADVPLAYGGYVFNVIPELRRRIHGHFLGEEIAKAPLVIEQLVANPRAVPEVIAVADIYQEAWAYFRERAGLIEAEIWQHHGRFINMNGEFENITHYLTRNILSALKLGDLNYIGSNLEWIEGMMINYNMPLEVLYDFLALYHRAASRVLKDQAGKIVVDWLAGVVSTCEAAHADPSYQSPVTME